MPTYRTARQLNDRITAYFDYIKGAYHLEEVTTKPGKGEPVTSTQKVWDREAESPTLSGLALWIGFSSRVAFEKYMAQGRFKRVLKRARLRIESEYEKKLHQQSSTGAIFALKNLGWNDKGDSQAVTDLFKLLQIEIMQSGPRPAASESEVVL